MSVSSVLASTVPGVAALIGYVGGLRTLIWASESIEGLLPADLRGRLVARLEGWWAIVRTTHFPVLAREECANLVRRFERLLEEDGHPRSLKLAVSFLLTTLAFVLGRILWGIASLSGMRVAGLESLVAPWHVEAADRGWVELLFVLLYLLPDVFLIRKLLRAIRDPGSRIATLASGSIQYLILISLVDLANPPAWPSSRVFLSAGILLLALWKLPSRVVRGNRVLSARLGGLSALLLGVLAYLRNDADPLVRVYMAFVYYGGNWVFDSLTVTTTHRILRRVSAGNSLGNALWIGLDAALALAFAAVVYVIVMFNSSAFYRLAFGGDIAISEIGLEVVQWSVQALWELRLGTVFFALTTFIPTVIYAWTLSLRFIGRAAWLVSGHATRIFFRRPEPQEQRSPIYLTLVAIALVLSFAPAYLAWFSAHQVITR